MKKDLTQLEIPRLPEAFNLTDGHAHRQWDKDEQTIVNDIQALYQSTEREQQSEIEKNFIRAFYNLTAQTVNYDRSKYLLLPSASISLEIVANFLRIGKFRLALTEPCFDNLANIFKRHSIPLISLPDEALEKDGLRRLLEVTACDALCVVSPNNPTGISYSRHNFEELVEYCRRHRKLLVLDTSFRAYRAPEVAFDEHRILQESGIDYIVVEDTGKTWPTKELKVSLMAMSPSVYQPVYDIYTDFIYHHSPFVIRLLTRFIENSTKDGLRSVRSVVEANRQELYKAVQGTFLKPTERPGTSVAWLAVRLDMTAQELVDRLAKNRIFILPGNYFFWNNKNKGDDFIRIALVRDPTVFQAACVALRRVLLAMK